MPSASHAQLPYHQRPRAFHPAAASPSVQDHLLASCAELTGVEILKEPA